MGSQNYRKDGLVRLTLADFHIVLLKKKSIHAAMSIVHYKAKEAEQLPGIQSNLLKQIDLYILFLDGSKHVSVGPSKGVSWNPVFTFPKSWITPDL